MPRNAQEWLNEKYKTNKDGVTKLYIDEKDLEGELDLTGFTNLEKIYISHYIGENDEIKLGIKDEEKIVKLVNAQKFLEKYTEEYPDKETLDLSNKNLEGNLDLTKFTDLDEVNVTGNPYLGEIKNPNLETNVIRWNDIQEWFDKKYSDKDKVIKIDFAELKEVDFNKESELKIEEFNNLKEIKKDDRDFLKVKKVTISGCPKLEKININSFKDNKELVLDEKLPNLTYLDCSSNNLKELDANNYSNLIELYCHNNRLTNITLPGNASNLKVLALLNNNFPAINLSFLENCVSLERLYLGNFTDHENDSLKQYEEKNIYNIRKLLLEKKTQTQQRCGEAFQRPEKRSWLAGTRVLFLGRCT